MALSKCPECDGDVSDESSICPHCGHNLHLQVTIREERPRIPIQIVIRKSPTKTSAGVGCLILFIIMWVLSSIVGSIESCQDGCRERQAEKRRRAEEASKISIPEITKYVCEIDGVGESKPSTEKTIRVLPESDEGRAGRVEIVKKRGFCERHRNETVNLIRRQRIVCPQCDSDSLEKELGTETILRADLPEGYQTDDHQTYRIVETVEDSSMCSSRTCKCIAGGTSEKTCRGNWKKEIGTNSTDNTKTVTISVPANETYSGYLGKKPRPILILSCSSDKTEVSIDNGGSIQHEYRRDNGVSMVIRYDNYPKKKLIARKDIVGTTLFLPNPINNIKRMLESDLLVYQFTPYQSGITTVSFDLRGLDQHISQLRQECHW